MVLRIEAELCRSAPAPLFSIRRLVGTHRYALVCQVRKREENIAELLVDRLAVALELLHFLADGPHAGHDLGSVLAGLLQFADSLAGLVTLRLQSFEALDALAALSIPLENLVDVDGGAPRLQRCRHRLGFSSDQAEVEHGVFCLAP